MTDTKAVEIVFFNRTGTWGPFSITSECGECALTRHIIKQTLSLELAHIRTLFVEKNWLECWWQPLKQGGWQTPIVYVDKRLISQGHILNKGVLEQAIVQAHAKKNPLKGNHLFGDPNCSHCLRARDYLDKSNIRYHYHNVVEQPHALFEMVARIQMIIGHSQPIGLPQIWLDGQYIGGAMELGAVLKHQIQPNHQRGQNSLSIRPSLSWPGVVS